jgi:WD40 repeat protein
MCDLEYIVGQENGDVAFYDITEGDLIMSIYNHKEAVGGVRLMAVSPTGSHLGNSLVLP